MKILSINNQMNKNNVNFEAYKMNKNIFNEVRQVTRLFPLDEICSFHPEKVQGSFYVGRPHLHLRKFLDNKGVKTLSKYKNIYLSFDDVWKGSEHHNDLAVFLEAAAQKAKRIMPKNIKAALVEIEKVKSAKNFNDLDIAKKNVADKLGLEYTFSPFY